MSIQNSNGASLNPKVDHANRLGNKAMRVKSNITNLEFLMQNSNPLGK
jgi:hypothetical protein